LLTEPGSHFELFAICKKQPHLEPTISKFRSSDNLMGRGVEIESAAEE
jgi:hypothetical protein